MSTSLKSKVIHGALWSFIERFGLLGTQFVISVVLARILSPEEFGLIGMITVFTLLAQVVVESGFGQALIQKQNATLIDESTAFWTNIVLGIVMTFSLFVAAPYIAIFYNKPVLEALTKASAFNMLINSFGVVQNALLQKELLFKRRTIASFSGISISGTVGILMAVNGFGTWSLIIQILINNTIRTIVLWISHPWRPALIFSGTSFKTLFKFGSNLLASGLVNAIFNNIYVLIIGKIHTAEALGFYQRAKEFVIASSNSISQVVAQVNFPVMSKLQKDPQRMQDAFRKILQSTLFIIVPSMVGLGVIAPNLVPWLLGSNWGPCVPYLQLLCLIGALFPIHLLNLNILQALGRTDIYLRLEIMKKALICVSIFITYQHGVMALLLGQVATNIIGLFLNSHYTRKTLRYGLTRQLLDNKKTLLSCFIMGMVLCSVNRIPFLNSGQLVIIQITVGVGVFLLMSLVQNDWVLYECVHVIDSRIHKERSDG